MMPASTDKVPGGALLFESRFESGNLRRAVHVNGNDFDAARIDDSGQSSYLSRLLAGMPACAYNAVVAQRAAEAGTITATTGQSICTACAAGSYIGSTGQTSCTTCPALFV